LKGLKVRGFQGSFRVVALASLLLLSFASPANAYIDSGTTSVLFQAVVAGGAAASLSLRLGWRRLRRSKANDGDRAVESVESVEGREPA
jgi:hypothetical protein